MNRIPSVASDARFLLAALALIAAAGSPWQAGADLPAYSGSAPVRVATVVITGFKFGPATVAVHAGDVFKWKNDDIAAQMVTGDGKADPNFDSGAIRTGADWLYLAQHKGTYDYVCAHHPT
jgi:plastocyanin